MKSLHLSHMMRLKNQDFPEAFSTICSILERTELNEPYLAACLSLAKVEFNKLGLLKNIRRKHPLSRTLHELILERQDYFSALRGRVTYCFKSPDVKERRAAKVLDFWLDGYSELLSIPRMRQQSLLVDQLLDDMSNSSAISDAMDDAGLRSYFNSIVDITQQIRETILVRSAQRQDYRKKAYTLKRSAYNTMKVLMNALHMAIKLDSEDKDTYVKYWNEICDILTMYNVDVLSRATRRKTAAEKEDAENENEQPMEGDEDANAELDDEMLGDALEGDANMDDVPVVHSAKSKSTRTLQNEPYHAVRLNGNGDMGTDLQPLKEGVDEPVSTADAMNGSGTLINDDAEASGNGTTVKAETHGLQTRASDELPVKDDALLDNAATLGGDADDGSANDSTAEDNATGHSDADDLFQE